MLHPVLQRLFNGRPLHVSALPFQFAWPAARPLTGAACWVLAAMLALPCSAPAQALFEAPPLSPSPVNSRNTPADPPGQVARISFMQGPVRVFASSAGDAGSSTQAWTAADLNRPLTRGDRILADRGARTELHVGSTAIRLDSLNNRSHVSLQRLDDSALLLFLDEGSLILRVRALFDGQRLEVSTPNLRFAVTQPGNYRLDVNLATDTTRVVVQSGAGAVYGDRLVPLVISAQQQGSFSGAGLTPAAPGAALQDSFDAWANAHDRQDDQSVTARYVPREVVGYQQLDTYGDWTQDATYGAVWLPRVVPVDWAPYRVGQWRWVAPWGWTWVDDAPWGFAPSHYGRWAQIGPRWGWVPGRLAPRPVYAPALVGFMGGFGNGNGAATWNIALGVDSGQRPGLGWFPLAPGEAYRPAYSTSPQYLTQINHNIVVNTLQINDAYRFQRQASAVTAAAADDFTRGRTVRGRPSGLSADELGRAPLMRNRFDAVPGFRGEALPTAISQRPSSTGGPSPASPPSPAQTGTTGAALPLAPTASPGGRWPVTAPAVGLAAPPRLVDEHGAGRDHHLFVDHDRRLGEHPDNRLPETLLAADIHARRAQQRLQFEQQQAQDHLARQQEAQRQRDQASIGERAMRLQQEQAHAQAQAQRISQQQQDAQRLEFHHAQQQHLQSQQQRIEARQQEATGQQALREQAERQRQSDERVRTQQNPRQSREFHGHEPSPGGAPRPYEKRVFGRTD